MIEERGAPRKREFVMEASVNGVSCTGVGPNKKIAKRNAAQALLAALGYVSPTSTTVKHNVTGNKVSVASVKLATNFLAEHTFKKKFQIELFKLWQ